LFCDVVPRLVEHVLIKLSQQFIKMLTVYIGSNC
jgi:hypothetical protein